MTDTTTYLHKVIPAGQQPHHLRETAQSEVRTVRYAGQRGIGVADILSMGLPDRVLIDDAINVAKRGLSELAAVVDAEPDLRAALVVPVSRALHDLGVGAERGVVRSVMAVVLTVNTAAIRLRYMCNKTEVTWRPSASVSGPGAGADPAAASVISAPVKAAAANSIATNNKPLPRTRTRRPGPPAARSVPHHPGEPQGRDAGEWQVRRHGDGGAAGRIRQPVAGVAGDLLGPGT
jgi:hypothetical protein